MQMRKKTRVDYSEVDYSGIEAIGMEVEIAVPVKDKKAKVGNTAEKKTGVKEKEKKMKEGKRKQYKKEVMKKLKEGKRKTTVNKKKKFEVKTRELAKRRTKLELLILELEEQIEEIEGNVGHAGQQKSS